MNGRFYTETGHAGYCKKHSRYLCDKCRRDEEREKDWGLFEWRSDGKYTRGTAIKVYKSRTLAENALKKMPAERNVVVRSLERE